jgi:hypothetical protein
MDTWWQITVFVERRNLLTYHFTGTGTTWRFIAAGKSGSFMGRFSMYGERYILVRERRQSSLGDDVFAVFQHFAGEAPQEKSQGLLLRFVVRKSDHDHGRYPFKKLTGDYLIAPSLKTKLPMV